MDRHHPNRSNHYSRGRGNRTGRGRGHDGPGRGHNRNNRNPLHNQNLSHMGQNGMQTPRATTIPTESHNSTRVRFETDAPADITPGTNATPAKRPPSDRSGWQTTARTLATPQYFNLPNYSTRTDFLPASFVATASATAPSASASIIVNTGTITTPNETTDAHPDTLTNTEESTANEVTDILHTDNEDEDIERAPRTEATATDHNTPDTSATANPAPDINHTTGPTKETDTVNPPNDEVIVAGVIPGTTIDLTTGFLTVNKPIANTYYIPNDKYQFNRSKNTEANNAAALTLLNQTTDFDKATETLIPLEPLRRELSNLRDTLQGVSMAFDKQAKSITRADTKPSFTHQCVNTKAKFQVPNSTENYPQIDSLLDTIRRDLSTLNSEYSKIGTQIITYGQKNLLFRLRLDRIHALFNSLIDGLGQHHVNHYRKKNKHTATIDPAKAPRSRRDLAKTAVAKLLTTLDFEILEYLDINRTQLIDTFKATHKPFPGYHELSSLDQEAIDHARDLMLVYIKPVTCSHYNKRIAYEIDRAAEAETLADMEKLEAKQAMSAVNDALQKQAASLPRDSKTLEETVNHIIAKRESKRKRDDIKAVKQTKRPRGNERGDRKKPPPPPRRGSTDSMRTTATSPTIQRRKQRPQKPQNHGKRP